jgi:tetratricopeptide (TPR) repeat protein
MNNLGTACEKAGRFDEALALYEASVRAEPRFELGHANAGHLWLRARRDCRRAVSHFQAALALRPDYAKARAGLAYCAR